MAAATNHLEVTKVPHTCSNDDGCIAVVTDASVFGTGETTGGS